MNSGKSEVKISNKPLFGSRWGEGMWIAGVLLVSLGVALCSKADLGVSMIAAPAFIIQEALAPYIPWLSVGVTEYVFQGAILLLMCLIIRRFDWRYLMSFAVAVIYGYVLDMWLMILGDAPVSEIWAKYLLLFAGILSTAAGVACFFRTYLPIEIYELFVAEVAARYNIKQARMKFIYDFTQLALTVTLAFTLFSPAEFDWSGIYREAYHALGPGTVIATFINAPIIALIGAGMDKAFGKEPLFPRLEKALQVRRGTFEKGPDGKTGAVSISSDTENAE